MNMTKKQLLTGVSILSVVLLSACHHDGDEEEPIITSVDYSFEVTVTNLTHSQPLSPITVVSHGEISLWQTGSSASAGVELLAESGDNSIILASSELISRTLKIT